MDRVLSTELIKQCRDVKRLTLDVLPDQLRHLRRPVQTAQSSTGAATQPPTASRLESLKLYALQVVNAVAGSYLVDVP